MKKTITLVLAGLLIAFSTIIFSSCGSDYTEGGYCQYCGTKTNWTYEGGGYVCWSCDD